jgi:spore coat protein H
LIRETIAYDLLDEAGLVAAETAFYEVSLDHGEGAQNLGLYTMVEVLDDTLVRRSFKDAGGTIYEANGPAASLAEGTVEQIRESFKKENDEQEADWSDIAALYAVLHSEDRLADAEAWRTSLEAVFDVDVFLKWLGLSAAIQHRDTYGAAPHNYYLYHDPASGKLIWISWDHNLVLGAPGGTPAGQGSDRQRRVALDQADVGDDWPLIRYLLDDPTYYGRYIRSLKQTAEFFDAEKSAVKYQKLAQLLEPSVARQGNVEAFHAAMQELTARTNEYAGAVAGFLAAQ